MGDCAPLVAMAIGAMLGISIANILTYHFTKRENERKLRFLEEYQKDRKIKIDGEVDTSPKRFLDE